MAKDANEIRSRSPTPEVAKHPVQSTSERKGKRVSKFDYSKGKKIPLFKQDPSEHELNLSDVSTDSGEQLQEDATPTVPLKSMIHKTPKGSGNPPQNRKTRQTSNIDVHGDMESNRNKQVGRQTDTPLPIIHRASAAANSKQVSRTITPPDLEEKAEPAICLSSEDESDESDSGEDEIPHLAPEPKAVIPKAQQKPIVESAKKSTIRMGRVIVSAKELHLNDGHDNEPGAAITARITQVIPLAAKTELSKFPSSTEPVNGRTVKVSTTNTPNISQTPVSGATIPENIAKQGSAATAMFRNILELVEDPKQWIDQTILRDTDYEYAKDTVSQEAAGSYAHSSAKDVLQYLFHKISDEPDMTHHERQRQYSEIMLYFTGVIDPRVKGDLPSDSRPAAGITNASSIWRPYFRDVLTWPKAAWLTMNGKTQDMRREVCRDIVACAPHVLRTESWVLLLVFAVLPKLELFALLESRRIRLTKDWYDVCLAELLKRYCLTQSSMGFLDVVQAFAQLRHIVQINDDSKNNHDISFSENVIDVKVNREVSSELEDLDSEPDLAGRNEGMNGQSRAGELFNIGPSTQIEGTRPGCNRGKRPSPPSTNEPRARRQKRGMAVPSSKK